MTPNCLTILIHYYVCPEPHPRIGAMACQKTVKIFIDDGIFEVVADRKDMYVVTEKGRAWIRMILKTPYPIPAYINSNGQKV